MGMGMRLPVPESLLEQPKMNGEYRGLDNIDGNPGPKL